VDKELATDQSFGKEHRLHGKKDVDQLFKAGKGVFGELLRGKFLTLSSEAEIPSFEILISVPKRNFKRAHDRNRIKRLLREVVRKNKSEVIPLLQKKKINLHLALIFQGTTLPSFAIVEDAYTKLVVQLTKKINHANPS
jgi:ribonuclease P protein component